MDSQPAPGQAPHQPGRSATGTWRGLLPNRASLKQDALAGLTGAISSVPDGMASGVLAGISPIHGLYASMVGPIAGGLTASTQLLVVATTSAAAIAASDALGSMSGEERLGALLLLTTLVGAVQIGAGLLLHLTQVDLRTIAVGVLTLLLAIVLPRTRLGTLGTLVALVIPSALVLLLRWDAVQTIADSGEIPRGLPMPAVPPISLLSLDLISGAVAIAAIILVQGAGVSQSVPNPDGRASHPSRDFVAQGVANVASGLFQGQPVGGSVSSTALSVQAGAQTRWAAVFAGFWMALILAILTGPVSYIAMPALAALLILAGFGTIKIDELSSIWRTGASRSGHPRSGCRATP